ncbi:MAG: oligosaccharide flippase family protein, partial [Actinomycetota bacterium]|nr:oligosaccharide flippase family protein [Actinomycetota bacterium]
MSAFMNGPESSTSGGGRAAGNPSEARSYGRRASLLSLGVGLTGLITYLYFVIASHELSPEQYGEVAVLWSAVFITVSTLQRPVEQLLSRSVSEQISLGRSYSRSVRVAATIQLGISIAFVAIAILLRGPIEDGLLNGNEALFWIGVTAVAAYGASYFARGFLAGSNRLTVYALLIISESLSRTAFPLAVAMGIASGQDAIALGIVAAPALSLVVVPFAFLRRGSAPDAPAEEGAAEQGELPDEGEFTLAHGGGFAAAVFL